MERGIRLSVLMSVSDFVPRTIATSIPFLGFSRLTVELTTACYRVSHTTVAMYTRQMGLRSKFYPTYRTTTDSKYGNNLADNLLDRKVVGYSISRTMKASDIVILAFKMAINVRQSSPNYFVNIG